MQPLLNVETNGSEFKARMARIAAGLNGKVDSAVRSFADELVTRLNLSTPVDTGQARSNWIVSIGLKDDRYTPLPDYAARRGKGKPSVGVMSAAEGAAHQAISRFNNRMNVLYVQNNAPYIAYLNNGTAKQGGRFFVETSILDAKRILSDLRLIG